MLLAGVPAAAMWMAGVGQAQDSQPRRKAASPFGHSVVQAQGVVPQAPVSPQPITNPYAHIEQGSINQYGNGYETQMFDPAAGEPQDIQYDQAFSGPAVAPLIYTPYADLSYVGGRFGMGGESVLFLPFIQDESNIIFSDMRGWFADSGNIQGSFGFGLRHIAPDNVIYGVNAFYDYRQTENSAEMQQVSIGGEAITYLWEARINGYISNGRSNHFNPNANLIGTKLWLDSTFEQSFSGLDFEGGALLLTNALTTFEIRGFAGGFYFDPNGTGNTIGGPSGRLEARMYDLPAFGYGSRLTAAVEATWDDVRETQVTGMAQLRIPFGPGRNAPTLDTFSRRMLDRVVRQRQIVSDDVHTREPVASPMTGRPIVTTLFANNANFNAAVNAAGYDSLVIAQGNITTAGQTKLFRGQTILGGGGTIPIVGTQTGTVGTFTAPGVRPTITSTNPAQAVFRPETDTALVGMNIVGGARGVDVHTNRNIHLVGLDISGSAFDGVRMINDQNIFIRHTTVHDTGTNGIFLKNIPGINLANVTVNNAATDAIHIEQGTAVNLTNIHVDGAVAGNGINIINSISGNLKDIDVKNTGLDGVVFNGDQTFTLSNFLISNTTQDGIQVDNSNNIAIKDGQVLNATVDGLQVNTSNTISLNNVTFNTIGDDVIEFIGNPTNLSGTGNRAFNFTPPLSTGTVGSGQFNFVTPVGTAP